MLGERIEEISKASGVPAEKMIKLNPADFIEKNKYQVIDGYQYQNIRDWIKQTKTDDNYLISPLDAVEETANQISYKENKIDVTVRASKCECVPIPERVALSFFVKNHRQSLPVLRSTEISYGLIYKGRLVAVMTYDKANGAVRGDLKYYELIRLAIAHGYRVHGGASKLQKACEKALLELGETRVMSYSNATINNGAVYKALGFVEKKVDGGQPFVIMNNFKITRLITLFPFSTDFALAKRGRIKTHIGGNKTWIKDIEPDD